MKGESEPIDTWGETVAPPLRPRNTPEFQRWTDEPVPQSWSRAPLSFPVYRQIFTGIGIVSGLTSMALIGMNNGYFEDPDKHGVGTLIGLLLGLVLLVVSVCLLMFAPFVDKVIHRRSMHRWEEFEYIPKRDAMLAWEGRAFERYRQALEVWKQTWICQDCEAVFQRDGPGA